MDSSLYVSSDSGFKYLSSVFVDLQREKKEFDKEQVLSFIKRKCNVPEQKTCLMKIL